MANNPLPLVVQSWDGKSKEFTVEKLVNFYIELGPQTLTAKSPVSIINRPMLVNWLSVGDGPLRGWEMMGGDLYVVSGIEVIKVERDQTQTVLGIISGTGFVSMAENGAQVSIVADNKSWVATATDLTQVTSDAFPGATTVTYLDTFGIYSTPDSGQYFISGQLDFNAFNALDFKTAESDPDDLVAVFSNHRLLWLFGEETIQVHYNSGAGDFPFTLLNDIVIERGLGARFSVAKEDNTLFFLGDDGLVYRFSGYTPQIISTTPIATKIAGYSKAAAVGQFIDFESHKFYILSFPEATLVYDLTTQLWFDWETTGGPWDAQLFIEAFGLKLAADRTSGQIYLLSGDTFDDAGTPVVSRVRYPPVHYRRRRTAIRSIECGLDSGEGEEEGLVMMRLSSDGKTWSQPRVASFGKPGAYSKRAIFRKCGLLDRQLHVEFSISAKVPRRIIEGWINL